MTLEELKRTSKLMLTPADIAPILHCDPHAIRLMARSKPERLGFPITVVRTRTLIPRGPFLAWVTGGCRRSAAQGQSIREALGTLEDALTEALGDEAAGPIRTSLQEMIDAAVCKLIAPEKGEQTQ